MIAQGYAGLEDRLDLLGSTESVVVNHNPLPVLSSLRLALAPGAYIGASFLLTGAGFFAKKTRHLAIGFGVSGILFALLASDLVARNLAPLVDSIRLGDVYAHLPFRMIHVVHMCVALLAMMGWEAFLKERLWDYRLRMLVPGALIGLVLLPLLGAGFRTFLFLMGAGLILAVLIAATGRNLSVAVLLAVVVALELSAVALIGQNEGPTRPPPALGPHDPTFKGDPLLAKSEPNVDIGSYIAGTELMKGVPRGEGRLTNTNTVTMPQALYLEVESAEGYSSTQLDRYWKFTRELTLQKDNYNVTNFTGLPPTVREHLDVGWVISKTSVEGGLVVASSPATSESLYRVTDRPGRAELVGSWNVESTEAAREHVTDPGWSTTQPVVVEQDPGIAQSNRISGTVRVEAPSVNETVVEVTSDSDGLLVVRNMFHEGWAATIDGRPADVIPADYLNQAVAVPAGEHTVELTYSDPSVLPGVAITLLALTSLLVAAIALRRRESRVSEGS